ncbi:Eco57I restriction-modification methylase domain-containing protein [Mesobacterium pallidum]|uniref:Eco57I restriction-modification methylase domain-containing protein n=1 Tax=Mesobacterium pallidum TaxID=2872037 RepID=UPI001EE1DB67|nr:Eco57I restriction-modification methylase domain-containing protein [Mesobacterium pallidum]
MNVEEGFALRGRNPDVLTCIANLSNDEVFTPPVFASQMLDTVSASWAADHDGADIWADQTVKFLDPFTKSGVFLREITKRLIMGLESEIPNLQERVDHILTQQVFGIGTTQLTSLMARRSVYCSKFANGQHSVTRRFNSEVGNIWFERTEHTWATQDKCKYCGASKATLDRGEDRESHAYAFIHTDNIKTRIAELFGGEMQFDVIIGNPPYQLDDGGHGTSAAPIYQKFVEQAKNLEPRYLTMVIPSRWFAGGKGLDDFRQSMLSDNRLRSITDYLSAADVFPGVGLKGGVCYFLWDRDHPGECKISTNFKDWPVSEATRPLLERGAEIFIRFNEGVSILKKVMQVETGQADTLALPEDRRFDTMVSSARVFGFRTFFKGRKTKKPNDLLIYQNGGTGFVSREQVEGGAHLIDKWKLFAGYAAPGTGNRDTYPHRIISTPFIAGPGTVSSETYLSMGPLDTETEAKSALSYISCRLARFLVLLHKSSQHVTRKVYTFVPRQTWDRQWTDEMLYEKYGLTEDEIAFVEKIVRPMDMDLFENPAED